MMGKLKLDSYEKDIEEHLEKQALLSPADLEKEIGLLNRAAKIHSKVKRSITIRVNEIDLEAIKLKATKAGIPYQTYLNSIIHKDATSL